MSRLSDAELVPLNIVADEVREVFAERGHRVDQAMEVDPAFGSGWSRAAVTRDLAIEAASRAASRSGLDFRPVNGSGREFRMLIGTTDRRFRFRRARRRADGRLIVHSNSESALAHADEDSLFAQEQWVLAWIPSPDGLMDEVLVAEVVGFAPGSPGHLLLGPATSLGSRDLPGGGFTPSDEGLDGFDDDEFGDGFGTAAS